MSRIFHILVAVLLAGCTGSLPTSGTLPSVDGRNVGGVDAVSVGGVKADEVTSAVTTANGATDANTAGAAVRRDASGNFSAGTITATINGNAATATVASWARGKQGTDIPSTATLSLPEDGNYFSVTGSTTITGMSARQAGERVMLLFLGTLTLVHNDSTFVLNGGGNYKVSSGDFIEFISGGNGAWHELSRNVHNDSEVFADATAPATLNINSGEKQLVYGNETLDTQDEYDPATGVFTAKQSGTYLVNASFYTNSQQWTITSYCRIAVKKSGNYVATIIQPMAGADEACYARIHAPLRLTPGQTITIHAYANLGATTAAAPTTSTIYQLRIKRLGGMQ